MSGSPATPPDPERVLNENIHAGGANKPFREVTAEEVRARADELREATGWGPTAKIGPVAMAWSMLAKQMEASGAKTVGELDPAAVAAQAERLRVVPPGGSYL